MSLFNYLSNSNNATIINNTNIKVKIGHNLIKNLKIKPPVDVHLFFFTTTCFSKKFLLFWSLKKYMFKCSIVCFYEFFIHPNTIYKSFLRITNLEIEA